MKTKYDYVDGKVDKKNKRRKEFIRDMSYIMQQFESSNEDVIELINWLYCISDNVHYYSDDEFMKNDVEIEPTKCIDKDKYMREVFVGDLHLFSYALLLHEYVYSQEKDVLYDIIYTLYKKLDEIVHPYQERDKDLENIKYFVELDYES
jgi:hypothetical protein